MAILSAQQIAQLAYNAGFRGAALNTAVEIALAESGGNTQAYNPELSAGTANGSGSRGLWQIYGTAHPEYNNDGAFNPQTNAQAAFKVYQEAGNRFTPWSTYNLGMGNPRQNYAAMIGGSTMAQAVQRVTGRQTQRTNTPQGQQSPPLTNRLAGDLSSLQGQGQSAATVKQPLGFFEWLANQKNPDGKAKPHPETFTDFVFLGVGVALILLSILLLLAGGYIGATNAQGKFIMKNASKIAPLVA